MAEPSSSLPTPAAAAAAEAPNTAAPEAMTMARKAEFALLAVCVIWGASFTVCKDGMRFSSPQVFTFLRMVVATAALAGVYWKGLDRTHLKGGLVTGAAMYAGFALQTAGLQLTPAARNSFITSLCLPLTPVCQALIFWRRPQIKDVAGVPLALLGVFLITRPSSKTGGGQVEAGELAGQEFCLPPPPPSGGMASETKGDLLTLACAVFFAVHIVALNHFSATERGEGAFKTIAILQLAVTGFLSALFCNVTERPCLHPSARLGWDVAAAGLLASALAFSVFAWSQKHLSATRSAIICATESLWAALTAYFVNGDVMSGTNLAGGAIILAAVTAPDWLPLLVPAWGAEKAEGVAGEVGGDGTAGGGEGGLELVGKAPTGDVEAAPLLRAQEGD